MTETDRNIRRLLQQELDDVLFSRMELDDQTRQKIREQAAAKRPRRKLVLPKAWILGTTVAALAAAVFIFAVGMPPSNQGTVGSEISQLTAAPLGTIDEAKASFGSDLLVPQARPDGFTLAEIVAVGMEGKPVRDVIFTYVSGEKEVTFIASRQTAAFPADLFTPIKVNDAEGYVFEQPELTELYWMEDGIQYSVVGHLSAEDTLKFAQSVKP